MNIFIIQAYKYNGRHFSAISLTVIMLCVCTKRICKVYKLVCKTARLAFSCQTSASSFLFIPIPRPGLPTKDNLLNFQLLHPAAAQVITFLPNCVVK